MADPTIAPTGKREPLPWFGIVLLAMFAELMAAPFFSRVPGGTLAFRSFTVVVLLGALSAAGVRRTGLLLFAPMLIAQLLALRSESPLVHAAFALLHLVFVAYVFGFLLARVARARTVSIDTIAGAACAYLVIALIWADLYMLVELWHPGSFQIPADWLAGSNHNLRNALVYFSFVTMTTVGHVFDVADPATGTLCIAETLVGQLYLAVLIARMVGLNASQRPP